MSLANFHKIGTKIIGVGLNYKDHAAEMKSPLPKEPLIFAKGTNSYITEGTPIEIPPGCEKLSQEVELGVIIGKTAKNVAIDQAMDYIGGYTVALDMTARDFQEDAKNKGHPWFLAKSFDSSCPIAGFIEKDKIDPKNTEIFCLINGQPQQKSNTNNLIFDIPTLIEYITKFVTLYQGDMILTGTPSGVGVLKSGDKIDFGIIGVETATFYVK